MHSNMGQQASKRRKSQLCAKPEDLCSGVCQLKSAGSCQVCVICEEGEIHPRSHSESCQPLQLQPCDCNNRGSTTSEHQSRHSNREGYDAFSRLRNSFRNSWQDTSHASGTSKASSRSRRRDREHSFYIEPSSAIESCRVNITCQDENNREVCRSTTCIFAGPSASTSPSSHYDNPFKSRKRSFSATPMTSDYQDTDDSRHRVGDTASERKLIDKCIDVTTQTSSKFPSRSNISLQDSRPSRVCVKASVQSLREADSGADVIRVSSEITIRQQPKDDRQREKEDYDRDDVSSKYSRQSIDSRRRGSRSSLRKRRDDDQSSTVTLFDRDGHRSEGPDDQRSIRSEEQKRKGARFGRRPSVVSFQDEGYSDTGRTATKQGVDGTKRPGRSISAVLGYDAQPSRLEDTRFDEQPSAATSGESYRTEQTMQQQLDETRFADQPSADTLKERDAYGPQYSDERSADKDRYESDTGIPRGQDFSSEQQYQDDSAIEATYQQRGEDYDDGYAVQQTRSDGLQRRSQPEAADFQGRDDVETDYTSQETAARYRDTRGSPRTQDVDDYETEYASQQQRPSYAERTGEPARQDYEASYDAQQFRPSAVRRGSRQETSDYRDADIYDTDYSSQQQRQERSAPARRGSRVESPIYQETDAYDTEYAPQRKQQGRPAATRRSSQIEAPMAQEADAYGTEYAPQQRWQERPAAARRSSQYEAPPYQETDAYGAEYDSRRQMPAYRDGQPGTTSAGQRGAPGFHDRDVYEDDYSPQQKRPLSPRRDDRPGAEDSQGIDSYETGYVSQPKRPSYTRRGSQPADDYATGYTPQRQRFEGARRGSQPEVEEFQETTYYEKGYAPQQRRPGRPSAVARQDDYEAGYNLQQKRPSASRRASQAVAADYQDVDVYDTGYGAQRKQPADARRGVRPGADREDLGEYETGYGAQQREIRGPRRASQRIDADDYGTGYAPPQRRSRAPKAYDDVVEEYDTGYALQTRRSRGVRQGGQPQEYETEYGPSRQRLAGQARERGYEPREGDYETDYSSRQRRSIRGSKSEEYRRPREKGPLTSESETYGRVGQRLETRDSQIEKYKPETEAKESKAEEEEESSSEDEKDNKSNIFFIQPVVVCYHQHQHQQQPQPSCSCPCPCPCPCSTMSTYCEYPCSLCNCDPCFPCQPPPMSTACQPYPISMSTSCHPLPISCTPPTPCINNCICFDTKQLEDLAKNDENKKKHKRKSSHSRSSRLS